MGSRPVNLSWGSQRHAQLGLPIVTQNSTLPQLVHFFNDVGLSSVDDDKVGWLWRVSLHRGRWKTVQF